MAQFDNIDLTSYPPHYTKDLETERLLKAWRDALTGSFCETFCAGSGSFTEVTAQYPVVQGVRYNDGCDKIITAVTITCVNSGSGGVTRVDVRKATTGQPTADKSIFSNEVFKAILSASAGDGATTRTTTIVAASASWLRGDYIAAVREAAAGAAGSLSAQTGVTVRVWWKPSGSY